MWQTPSKYANLKTHKRGSLSIFWDSSTPLNGKGFPPRGISRSHCGNLGRRLNIFHIYHSSPQTCCQRSWRSCCGSRRGLSLKHEIWDELAFTGREQQGSTSTIPHHWTEQGVLQPRPSFSLEISEQIKLGRSSINHVLPNSSLKSSMVSIDGLYCFCCFMIIIFSILTVEVSDSIFCWLVITTVSFMKQKYKTLYETRSDLGLQMRLKRAS